MIYREKNKFIKPITSLFVLLILLFLFLHGAIAHETTVNAAAGDSIDMLYIFFSNWGEQVTQSPLSLRFAPFTKEFSFFAFAIWILFLFSFLKNKKYINGIEYGSAKWSDPKSLKELYAAALCKREVLSVNLERFYLVRRKNYIKQKKQVNKAYKDLKDKLKISGYDMPKNEQNLLLTTYDDAHNNEIEFLSSQFKAGKRTKAERKAKISEIRKKYMYADMILTATEKISIHNFILNNNTIVFGGAGCGKTRTFVIPNLLQAHSSYVITDPKGEILEKTGNFLLKNGYVLKILNLYQKHESGYYNPFCYLHKDRKGFEENVLTLIDTIIMNTDGDKNQGSSSDPFWEKGEKLFLQAIFFFTAYGFPEEEANISTVLELISMLQIGEEEDNRDSDLDIFCEIFAEKFGNDNIAVEQYREFRSKASGKTAKSIVISAVARLAPFRTKEIKRIFQKDTFNLENVGEEKTAVFVIMPPTDKSLNFIAGMFYTQLFQELNYCATEKHKSNGMRLPVPCRFILDEFANTCQIPNFVSILAYARSLNIGISIILQSLEQLKEMYEKSWGTVIDNCSTMLYLGRVRHYETLKYLSDLLGKGTFDKYSTSESRGGNKSHSTNYDKLGRELMTEDEIQTIPAEDCILFVSGRNSFYSKKYNYTSHPFYNMTSDGNRNNTFQYTPEQGTIGENALNEFSNPADDIEITYYDTETTITYLQKYGFDLELEDNETALVNTGDEDYLQYFEWLVADEKDSEETTSSEIAEFIKEVQNYSLPFDTSIKVVKDVVDIVQQEQEYPGSTEILIPCNDDNIIPDEELELLDLSDAEINSIYDVSTNVDDILKQLSELHDMENLFDTE